MRSPLPGRFNVSNTLAALATAAALGVGLEEAVTALASFRAAPGRFEPVDEGQDFAVLVDYAHTPDSLENVLRAARDLTDGRVIVVFGAGGDRDRGKRPLMGEIAARLADVAVVTSDNPRSEDPEAIIAEILEGPGPGVESLVDRREAIARAVGLGVRRRRRRRRRQGPRAGPGVRRRAQAAVRRRRGGARGPGRGRRADEGLDAGARRRGRRRAARRSRRRPERPGRSGRSSTRAQAGPGDLFVGLRGEHEDGGRFAPQALAAGAWGAIVAPDAAEAARCAPPGVLLAADEPLAALQGLAGAWRDALDAPRGRRHRARPARPRPRTSSPPCSRPTSPRWPARPTSTPRSACRWRSSALPPEPRRSCSRWRCGAPSRSPS